MCGGEGTAVSLSKLCLQLPSKERQYKHIELVLATKSSISLSEVRQTHALNKLPKVNNKSTNSLLHTLIHTHFKLLEGGRFAEQQRCGVLKISGHCTLFAAVFKVKASSFYYASLWTHQVGGSVIADNSMENKVVITYAYLEWIEVGSEQYVIAKCSPV